MGTSPSNAPAIAPNLPARGSQDSRAYRGYLYSGLALITILGWFGSSGAYFSTVVPSRHRDALEFIWTLWWHRHALAQSLPIYFTQYLFYPEGSSVLLHATVELLSLPAGVLAPHTDPVLLFSFLCVLCFCLNYLAMAAFLGRFFDSALLPRVLSLCFTLHPYFTAHLDGGHLNFLCFFPVIICFDRLLRTRTSFRQACIDGAWMALAVASLPLLNPYYAYFTLLGIFLLSCNVALGGRHGIQWILAPLLGLSCGGLASFWKLSAMSELLRSGAYTPNHNPLLHSADVLDFFYPHSVQTISVWLPTWKFNSPLNESETGLYLGWVALALLLVSLPQIKRSAQSGSWVLSCIVCLTLFVLLSLGPALHFAGTLSIHLPVYSSLAAILPAFPSVPARFGVMSIFFIYAAIAILNQGAISSARRLLLVLLSLAALTENFPRPVFSSELPPAGTPVLAIKNCAVVRAVIDLAPLEQNAMYRQTIHEKPIVGGYLARRPRAAEHRLRNDRFLRALRNQDGFDPQDPALQANFEGLRAQALIVESDTGVAASRLESIPWLVAGPSADRLRIFWNADIAAQCGN